MWLNEPPDHEDLFWRSVHRLLEFAKRASPDSFLEAEIGVLLRRAVAIRDEAARGKVRESN